MATKKSLLVGVAILTIAFPVRAYEFNGCGWSVTGYDGSCPTGFQGSDSCGCTVDSAPRWYGAQLTLRIENQGGNGISAADFVATVQSAAQSWNDVTCSTFVIDASETFAATDSAEFGTNELEHNVYFVMSENEWMNTVGSGAGSSLAVTTTPFYSSGCNEREFYDADILINGFVYGGWTQARLEPTVLHMLGVALGLANACLTSEESCPDSCLAAMTATADGISTPQQDDVDGICALYPGTPGGDGGAFDGGDGSAFDGGDCSALDGGDGGTLDGGDGSAFDGDGGTLDGGDGGTLDGGDDGSEGCSCDVRSTGGPNLGIWLSSLFAAFGLSRRKRTGLAQFTTPIQF